MSSFYNGAAFGPPADGDGQNRTRNSIASQGGVGDGPAGQLDNSLEQQNVAAAAAAAAAAQQARQQQELMAAAASQLSSPVTSFDTSAALSQLNTFDLGPQQWPNQMGTTLSPQEVDMINTPQYQFGLQNIFNPFADPNLSSQMMPFYNSGAQNSMMGPQVAQNTLMADFSTPNFDMSNSTTQFPNLNFQIGGVPTAQQGISTSSMDLDILPTTERMPSISAVPQLNNNSGSDLTSQSIPALTRMETAFRTQDLHDSPDSVPITSAASADLTDFQPQATGLAYEGVYSNSGFDMLDIFNRILTRPKPEIRIGAVDFSCAFVICDTSLPDDPIVYCSENFEKMTGYQSKEIIGRNCRFLQSPDGIMKSGSERKHTDSKAIGMLKHAVLHFREVQVSLTNFRKGGQPFMNLLTMIPIPEPNGPPIRVIGLQIDLVQHPDAIVSKNPGMKFQPVLYADLSDGSLTVNYKRPGFQSFSLPFIPDSGMTRDIPSLISHVEIGKIINSLNAKETNAVRPLFERVVLENHDDVIMVLSLKGVVQYVSAASRHVLEYDATDMIGKMLSNFTHPSDIVSVTRVLKDAGKEESVNFAFRISRKLSGFVWFECLGSLYTEQAKGKKHTILVCRERPAYSLSRAQVNAAGGIGENEIWSKVSTSGAFLFVSSTSKVLLDKSPDELIGLDFRDVMRVESRPDLDAALQESRLGKRSSFKHEMQNRRGHFLQARTVLYSGNPVEGQKPSFLIAQTVLVKHWRSSTLSAPSTIDKVVRDHGEAVSNQSGLPSSSNPAMAPSTNSQTDSSAHKANLLQAMGITSTANYWDNIHVAKQSRSVTSDMTMVPQSQSIAASSPVGVSSPGQRRDSMQMSSSMMEPPPLPIDEDLFEELKTTRSSAWQFELHQMIVKNKAAAEELATLLAARKKRKRRKVAGQIEKECTQCGTRDTPEWRRGPDGKRDLCNSCGLKYAKQASRQNSSKGSTQGSQSISEGSGGSKASKKQAWGDGKASSNATPMATA